MVVGCLRSSGLWVAPPTPMPIIPMIFTRSKTLLKGALLTVAGIATLYSGSASANTCVFSALASCNVSLPNFTINNVSYVARIPNDGATTSLGGFPTNATVTFSETTSGGKPALSVFVSQTGTQGLLRAANFNFAASVLDPTLFINGFNSVTTTLNNSTTVGRGGTFNAAFNGTTIQSGALYNSASGLDGLNTGPITNGTNAPLGQVWSTVALTLGYDSTSTGGLSNRPNSISGVFTTDVPLPLPVVGAGFAFGFTRKLRQRAKSVA
jgi:hypothetical protein